MPDVFLSYKRDDEAAASKVVAVLRQAGLDVWWDRDIPASAPWEQTIERALHEAGAVIVCWSPASVASDNVRSEARWARTRDKLIQAFLQPCDPPLFFGERQGVDLSRWSGHPSDPDIQALVSAVRDVLADRESALPRTGAPITAPAGPRRADTRRSVAVLPFANLTGDPGKDYLGDGMAEELICTLSRGSDLHVPARTSVFAYKGRGLDVRQIGRELGVEAVLEGSVRAAGERIRVTAILADAANGFQLWSQNYDRRFDDLFALQDELAAAIADSLRSHLKPVARSTEDLTAYDLYLQAGDLSHRSDVASVTAALELLDQAIARDPGFARAHVRIAGCLATLHLFHAAAPEWHAKAVAHLRRAVALDPLLSEAHVALAVEHLRRCRWEDAHDSFSIALALDDADATAHYMNAYRLMLTGCQHAALDEALRAVELSPRVSVLVQMIGMLGVHVGDFDLARRQFARLVELGAGESGNIQAILAFSIAFAEQRWPDVQELLARTLPADLRREGGDGVTGEIAEAFAGCGPPESGVAALDRLLASRAAEGWSDRFSSFAAIAIYLYAQLGAFDRAFAVADEIVAIWERGGRLELSMLSPLWRVDMGQIRADPRFETLLRRLGLFDYWQRHGPPEGYTIEGSRLLPA